jgi:hypothetical protein
MTFFSGSRAVEFAHPAMRSMLAQHLHERRMMQARCLKTIGYARLCLGTKAMNQSPGRAGCFQSRMLHPSAQRCSLPVENVIPKRIAGM